MSHSNSTALDSHLNQFVSNVLDSVLEEMNPDDGQPLRDQGSFTVSGQISEAEMEGKEKVQIGRGGV